MCVVIRLSHRDLVVQDPGRQDIKYELGYGKPQPSFHPMCLLSRDMESAYLPQPFSDREGIWGRREVMIKPLLPLCHALELNAVVTWSAGSHIK